MSKQYMEFLEYVNVDFKEKTLKETAFIAKQGEELAKQEFFSRIQPIIDRLSLTYSRNFGYPVEDYMDELYLAAYKALNSYQEEQGDFEHFIRSYLSNSIKWLTYEKSRKLKREYKYIIDIKSLSLVDACPIDIKDPYVPGIKELTEKQDTKILMKKLKSFVDDNCNMEERMVLSDIAYNRFSVSRAADILNLSNSGAYRHVVSLMKKMKEYLED